MKTKEESIKEAWGDNLPSEGINENGWSNEYIWHEDIDLNLFNTQLVGHGYCNRRPKSLYAIENNNGWIKPKEYIEVIQNSPCWVYTDQNQIYTYETYISHFSICETQKVTHYKIIEKPKPPIY